MSSGLGIVPVGAVLKRSYYAVPDTYTEGTTYPTFIAAVRGALIRREETRKRVREAYPKYDAANADRAADRAAAVKCVVDLRWELAYPDGGGIDIVIERQDVNHLTFEHCDRMERIARPDAGATVG